MTRKLKSSLTSSSSMGSSRKSSSSSSSSSSLSKQTTTTLAILLFTVSLFFVFILLSSSSSSSSSSSLPSSSLITTASLSSSKTPTNAQHNSKPVKIYMYDLPSKFTHDIIKHHSLVRGGNDAVSTLKYPGHQHMAEWYLFNDLNKPLSDRVGSSVTRVEEPDEAELFYVPVFSSLSLIVNQGKPGLETGRVVYSDEGMQEELVGWLEGQEYWRRNGGRDHVIVAQDPNALWKVVDRVKNAVLLVSDFGRLRRDQASLAKDVILPYSHRIRPYDGDIGVENRKTLLFFMGNRYRKEVI